MAERAITAPSAIAHYSMLSLFEIFDTTDPNLSEAKTSTGQSIWLTSDPVHLSHHAYDEIASTVLDQQPPGDGAPRQRKGIRLESVVPALPRGARGHQGRIRPPLWVSGMTSRRGVGGRPRALGGFPGSAGRWSWRPRGGGMHGSYGSGRSSYQNGGRGRY